MEAGILTHAEREQADLHTLNKVKATCVFDCPTRESDDDRQSQQQLIKCLPELDTFPLAFNIPSN